jgi:predicted nucleic acid-binding protein
MDVYVDASPLIALGAIGELDALEVLDGDLVVPPRVEAEVTTEPARTNLGRFLETVEHSDHPEWVRSAVEAETRERAREILDEPEHRGDTELIGAVLGYANADRPVGVVSDDRRVRTVADGLGATVTGTVGIVVRNVEDGELADDDAKDLVRELDGRGLHMTGELRETAYDLIDDAA